MEPDRIACSVSRVPPSAIREYLRACDLFERCGVWSPDEAAAWRESMPLVLLGVAGRRAGATSPH